MVAFPNPDLLVIYSQQTEHGAQLGDLWAAARVAGVQPGTIRVWMSRGKIEPVLRSDEADPQFHLPTIKKAAEAGRKYAPTDPAANSRGPHARIRVSA